MRPKVSTRAETPAWPWHGRRLRGASGRSHVEAKGRGGGGGSEKDVAPNRADTARKGGAHAAAKETDEGTKVSRPPTSHSERGGIAPDLWDWKGSQTHWTIT